MSYSYKDYLDLLRRRGATELHRDPTPFLARYRKSDGPFEHLMPVLFMVEYATRSYLYMADTCQPIIGYSSDYFMSGGIEAFWRLTNKDDFEVVNNTIFPKNLSLVNSIPTNQYFEYVFSHNFRMRTKDGRSITVLQRSSFLEGEIPGVPSGVIGVIYNITHFNNGSAIIHTIERITETNEVKNSELLHYQSHPVGEETVDIVFSQREMQVLRLIYAGLTSNAIAGKLGIARSTVDNHRKSMLRKADCANMNGVIQFATVRGML